MRILYPVAQNAVMDQADDNDNIVPGEWRNSFVMHDLGTNQKGRAKAAQKQEITLRCIITAQSVRFPGSILFYEL